MVGTISAEMQQILNIAERSMVQLQIQFTSAQGSNPSEAKCFPAIK